MESLSAANTQFNLNLFKKISGENTSGNVFYSPVSISSALAIVSLGARGNTADQMIKVLGFNNPSVAQAMMQQEHKPPALCGFRKQPEPSMMQQEHKPPPLCGIRKQPEPTMMQQEHKPPPLCGVRKQPEPSMMQQEHKPPTPCGVRKQPEPSMMQQEHKPPPLCGVRKQPETSMMEQEHKPPAPCGVRKQPETSMMQQTQKPAEHKKCPEDRTEDQIHSGFNKFMSELNKPGVPYVLSLANRLYGEQSYQFIENFLNDTKKYYEAELEKVDFKNKSEAARVNINKWVEDKTQEKIKDLLPQGVVDGMTKLVLVNAIYFKGNWEEKFPKDTTIDWEFQLNKNQTKPVKMMNQNAVFPVVFIPEINSQILELPYVGKNLSMLIILPNEIEDDTTGLQKLVKALTYENLMEWTKPEVMSIQEVHVSLPKFKMEETYDMKSLLISMGMEDVFDEQKVNLSGMSSSNDLVLSKVIHKAFIEVNEEGSEAAAATAFIMEEICCLPLLFNADHPFLFFIRHNPTKSILFYGRFCSP